MIFEIDYSAPSSELVVFYRISEYSFDTERSYGTTFTTVLINDLQLGITENSKIVLIWGLCPHMGWKAATLEPPAAKAGSARILNVSPYLQSVSVRLNKSLLPIFVCRKEGWVRIDGGRTPVSAVRLFQNVILEIDGEGQFSSLWIKLPDLPDFRPAKRMRHTPPLRVFRWREEGGAL